MWLHILPHTYHPEVDHEVEKILGYIDLSGLNETLKEQARQLGLSI